ncbi:NADP-dependent isocitrate dehydrogenase [Corynebacterium aquatimens]|uniref:Isocitrate dehydrogenase [NADP] n=1 Tax=Corynebacterium aquatimens TaxID=1190508 RepID=A0A931E368_9CORY|nr:NADP-dependent isocitrate dehydrogenase [Corynebacterium aquatimens]MBG6123097.1 isocitrate dehydrogenase [Corynebacterium aquatimens]WJY66570.1 Isocitrate dehydrogenase [NADP] [Corynebacterium aquatimens]
MATIIWTRTDEAPLLATYSFKPIVEAFAASADVAVETWDISLAARILAQFPERLDDDQRVPDYLAKLGELTKSPDANIIKLPNISASLVQLKKAIKELQDAGFDVPEYPSNPSSDEEKEIQAKYDAVKGSAVNPVLRQGNSDRRAPKSVKNYAKKHPHSMGEWSPESKTNVATMTHGDFRHTEKSVILDRDDTLTIKLVGDGREEVFRDDLVVGAGDVIDGAYMSVRALDEFLQESIVKAKELGVLFSVHLKATMMKVSDPIIFGHVVRAYFKNVYDKHGEALFAAGLDGENGLAAIFSGLDGMGEEGDEIRAELEATLARRANLAMVNSDKGITNLHVPSDVIVDASMPAMIRTSGHMWNAKGEEQDTLAVIPDSSYAGVYQVVIDDCRKNGAFDPSTMGTVPNIGLMAQKAEEYGSHNKTFKAPFAGEMQILSSSGDVLISHEIEEGDIWRCCCTRDAAIRDWITLAVDRARRMEMKAIFWLDPERAHDRNIATLVREQLAEMDTDGLDLDILSPEEATQVSIDRIRRGEDTISVTGNVLRDYNTDLFPILELGTSAKMLSVVPLMAGGGLFETGAGGSAPKHVEQVLEENHLRWDSLGEYLALTESFRHVADRHDNPKAAILGNTLDRAIESYLEKGRSPSRKVGEIDDRGSHAYIALYWAEELANQEEDADLAAHFTDVYNQLHDNVQQISDELMEVQGSPADLGGYYWPDEEKTTAVMRPSAKFNEIIDSLR